MKEHASLFDWEIDLFHFYGRVDTLEVLYTGVVRAQ